MPAARVRPIKFLQGPPPRYWRNQSLGGLHHHAIRRRAHTSGPEPPVAAPPRGGCTPRRRGDGRPGGGGARRLSAGRPKLHGGRQAAAGRSPRIGRGHRRRLLRKARGIPRNLRTRHRLPVPCLGGERYPGVPGAVRRAGCPCDADGEACCPAGPGHRWRCRCLCRGSAPDAGGFQGPVAYPLCAGHECQLGGVGATAGRLPGGIPGGGGGVSGWWCPWQLCHGVGTVPGQGLPL